MTEELTSLSAAGVVLSNVFFRLTIYPIKLPDRIPITKVSRLLPTTLLMNNGMDIVVA